MRRNEPPPSSPLEKAVANASLSHHETSRKLPVATAYERTYAPPRPAMRPPMPSDPDLLRKIDEEKRERREVDVATMRAFDALRSDLTAMREELTRTSFAVDQFAASAGTPTLDPPGSPSLRPTKPSIPVIRKSTGLAVGGVAVLIVDRLIDRLPEILSAIGKALH